MATRDGYEGGAGGKFRRRRAPPPTPYDRPTAALRPAQAAEKKNNNKYGGGWISKLLVDPASKLITAGAHRFYSSFFRKQLLPPPHNHPPSDAKEEGIDVPPGPSTVEPAVRQANDPIEISGGNGVAELEGILKQKTFTRSEIDHLTTLLLSRTADNSVGAEKGATEAKLSDMQAIHDGHEKFASLPGQESGLELVVSGAISTPVTRSKVLEEVVASPAELAKAYMGSRPIRASPSLLGLQTETHREDLSSPFNPPYKRPPTTSTHPKLVSDAGTSENGYVTPRFRGRSAIYSMARTPYSRIHPIGALKAAENAYDARGASPSRNATENNHYTGSQKQVLKRRSSVLENDIGSVGPIRRIRQKPNLLHPKTLTLPGSGGPHTTHASGAILDVDELPSSSKWSPHTHSLSKSKADNSMPSTSSDYVPSQSIEMAQKIFKQLDKFTPKGKSPELRLDTVGGNPPSKMTASMLGGLARRSMDSVDSLKVLQGIQESTKENDKLDSGDAHASKCKISPMVEGSNLNKFKVLSDNLAPQNGADGKSSTPEPLQNSQVTDSVVSQSGFDHHPKKRAFQMSAHEDFLELDDDVQLNGVASTPLIERGENSELSKKPATFSNDIAQNESMSVKSPIQEQSTSVNVLSSKKDSESLSNGPLATNKTTGLTFPGVPSSSPVASMGVQAAVTAPQPMLDFNKVVPQNVSNDAIPAFGLKSDNVAPFSFSKSSSSSFESAVQKDTKVELPSSANDTAGKPNGPAETEKKSNQQPLDVVRKSEDDPSPSNSPTKGIFNFGSAASSATFSNGFPNAAANGSNEPPALFSSTQSNQSSASVSFPVSLPPPSASNSSLSNGFAASTSTSATVTTGAMISTGIPSSSQLSSSITAPSVSSGSLFKFGSPAVPSTSAAFGSSAASEATAKTGDKPSETVFSSTSSSLFTTKSSETNAGGSSIFGFNSSTVKPASGNTQTPASNGSVFGFQASSSSAPVSLTSSQSIPSQFPSSTSSPTFGLNGASNFSSGPSVFAANTSSSNSAPASSSSASSMSSSSASASSGSTTNIFGSSWQPSKSTNPGSTFGATSASTGFSFGQASSGPASDGSKPAALFGSTGSSSAVGASSPFLFGSTSSSSVAAPVSSSSAAGGSSPFLFGAASSSAATAPVFSFSSVTSSAPSATLSPPQSVFGNNTSTPFAFGSTTPTQPSGNNDQMGMEDSMAEDSSPAGAPATPIFGQTQTQISAPSTGFTFGATPSSPALFGAPAASQPTANPFQFGGQQSQMGGQNPSPFQPSGSVEFNAGGAGSFSLGAGGDKSNRKIVKVKNRLRRK